MKKVMLLLCCLGIPMSGCATTGKYEERLKEWVGKDVSELIKTVGIPTESFHLPNGEKAYSYYYREEDIRSPASRWIGQSLDSSEITLYSCTATFYAGIDNKITNWIHRGGSCSIH